MLRIIVPGAEDLALVHLVLDVNGTLTNRGRLIDGVAERLAKLHDVLALHLLSADTFGIAADVAAELRAGFRRVHSGAEKRAYVESLGAERTAAVGNGRNDAEMLAAAALGIAVLGPEGASGSVIAAADVVTSSVAAALDLIIDPPALAATLRA